MTNGNILDLLFVVDKGVVGDFVVFRAGSQVNANRAVGKVVMADDVKQRVVDKQPLAFTARNMDAVAYTSLNVGGMIVFDGRIGDVVEQYAVVVVVVGMVVKYRQLAALHKCVAGSGAHRAVVGDAVAVGEHVVNTVAHIAQAVVIDQAVVTGFDIDT